MSLLSRIFGPQDTGATKEIVSALELRVRRLEEEWTEVYGKFRTMQMRVAKQVQRLDENSSLEEPQPAGSDGTEEAGDSPQFTSLSPRQAQIQREIMERRRRGATGGK